MYNININSNKYHTTYSLRVTYIFLSQKKTKTNSLSLNTAKLYHSSVHYLAWFVLTTQERLTLSIWRCSTVSFYFRMIYSLTSQGFVSSLMFPPLFCPL